MNPRELYEKIKQGVIPIMMTPFTSDDQLDEDGLRKQVQWLFEKDKSNQLRGFLLTGTNAEWYALSEEEFTRSIRIVVDEVAGRLPIFAGAHAVGTKNSIELAKKVQDLGVDGLQVVNPYYIYPSQEGVIKHLVAVAKAVDIALELYNNPITTHIYLPATTIKAVVDEVGDKVVCIKENSPTPNHFYEMVMTVGDRIHVIDNNGGFPHMIWAASLGCRTFMFQPPWAQLAFEFSLAAQAKDFARMREVAARFRPISQFFATTEDATDGWTYIQVIKAAMEYLGMPAGEARMPLLPMSAEKKQKLHRLIDEAGLKG